MPYQTTTQRSHKPRSGMALGGLGCGWFEIRQDGTFQNWNIFNNRPVARGPLFSTSEIPSHSVLFFLVRFQEQGRDPRIRLLQIEESHGSAGLEGHEFQYIFPWLDGVDEITFEAAVPFANLRFLDRDMPFEVNLRAWSPFIPHDAANSALPAAFFDFSLRSHSKVPVDVTLIASLRNCVGYDVREKLWVGCVEKSKSFVGCELGASGLPQNHPSAGTMALASADPQTRVYGGWGHPHPYYERVLREDQFPESEEITDRNGRDNPEDRLYAKHPCFASLGRSTRLEPGKEFSHTYVFAWDFPNRMARLPDDKDGTAGYLEEAEETIGTSLQEARCEGHFYSNNFSSAFEVARHVLQTAPKLREESERFYEALHQSTLPFYVTDQINAQLNTFRTSTWFTKAGDFGILEGLGPKQSYAGLSTTDVAMYGHVMTAGLFPELDRAVIRSHARFQRPNGVICHSITQNFQATDPREATGKRIDMPAQFAYMALRCALWSDDKAFLAEIWPSVKAALDYVLRERDANRDLLPDMEGIMCSYDNFPMFGVAPYVATQWLAAISAAVKAAAELGDNEAAVRYHEVLALGSQHLENVAWNGEYYQLSTEGDPADAAGCLTDQMFGLWACHLLDLPGFLDKSRVNSALFSILAKNFRPQQGLRNCQWPDDGFLHPVPDDCWVDQANTCWTGVEFAFASLLLYEGLQEEALAIVRCVDERYRKSGLFWDHQEFGGHYFRPMSAWSLLYAAAGMRQRGGIITFDPKVDRKNCRLFFSTPNGYGHYIESPGCIEIRILSGQLRCREVRLRLPEGTESRPWKLEVPGNSAIEGSWLVLTFAEGFSCLAGTSILVSSK